MNEERKPDMTRPIPAPPSPGSSAARAKLTDADRKRIGAAEAAKHKGKPLKPDIVGVQYSFRRGDQDWAVLKDGHYWVYRAGDFAPGAIVTQRDGPLRGRLGRVTQLWSPCGDAVCVVVRWQRLAKDVMPPYAFWRMDELEVLTKAR